MTWIKQLFCIHEWEELYHDIEGFCELHYCFICKKCKKEKND